MQSKALDSFTYLHQVPGPKGSLQFTNPDLFYVVQVIVNTGIKENLLTYLSSPSPHPLLGITMNEKPWKHVYLGEHALDNSRFFAKGLRSKKVIIYDKTIYKSSLSHSVFHFSFELNGILFL